MGSGTLITIGKGGVFIAGNKPNINDTEATPDNSQSYFESRTIGGYTSHVNYVTIMGLNHAYGGVFIGGLKPIHFGWGETLLGIYPLLTARTTNERVGPVCVGFDPDSGSNVGVTLTSQRTTGGKQLNLNRPCIARTFPLTRRNQFRRNHPHH
jgi:hypothetical protein